MSKIVSEKFGETILDFNESSVLIEKVTKLIGVDNIMGSTIHHRVISKDTLNMEIEAHNDLNIRWSRIYANYWAFFLAKKCWYKSQRLLAGRHRRSSSPLSKWGAARSAPPHWAQRASGSKLMLWLLPTYNILQFTPLVPVRVIQSTTSHTNVIYLQVNQFIFWHHLCKGRYCGTNSVRVTLRLSPGSVNNEPSSPRRSYRLTGLYSK